VTTLLVGKSASSKALEGVKATPPKHPFFHGPYLATPPLHPVGIHLPMGARELLTEPRDGKQLSPRYFTNDGVATTRKVRPVPWKTAQFRPEEESGAQHPAPGAAFPTIQRKSTNP